MTLLELTVQSSTHRGYWLLFVYERLAKLYHTTNICLSDLATALYDPYSDREG